MESASFDDITLVISPSLLTPSTETLATEGTVGLAYSFDISVIDIQNQAYQASPNVIKSVLNIEEP